MRWKSMFSPVILARGEEYYTSKCVHNLKIEEDELSAVVEGTENYQVTIALSEDTITDMECSCPYAASGYYCKHMAAVLYKYVELNHGLIDSEYENHYDTNDYFDDDDEYDGDDQYDDDDEFDNDDQYDGDDEFDDDDRYYNGNEFGHHNHNKKATISLLIDKISPEKQKELLCQYIAGNHELYSQLKMQYDFTMDAKELARLKREITCISDKYGGREGYINWEEADAYSYDLVAFLRTRIPPIIEHGYCMPAFELVNEVLWEIANTEIDDYEGSISEVTDFCFGFLEEILAQCSLPDREKLEKWFRMNKSNTRAYGDYVEYIDAFYEEHFLTRSELTELLSVYDEILEKNENGPKDSCLYSVHKHLQPVALLRIDCMKRLGMSQEEILTFRQEHRQLHSIRELELQEAMAAQDYENAILLLQESKRLDTDDEKIQNEVSCQLIDLYRQTGRMESCKEELMNQISSFYQRDLGYYHQLKTLITNPEEWKEIVDQILKNCRDDYHFLPEVCLEEERYDELMNLVEKHFISFLSTRYLIIMGEHFPKRVIELLEDHLMSAMESANSRDKYRHIIEYLKVMAKFEGGLATAKGISEKWKTIHKRRSAMLEELKWAGF